MDVIISALIEANKLLNKKDYYKALDCFECVLNINPTNNLAIIGKTICIHYLKSFDNISLINIYEEKLNVNLKLAELYECGGLRDNVHLREPASQNSQTSRYRKYRRARNSALRNRENQYARKSLPSKAA